MKTNTLEFLIPKHPRTGARKKILVVNAYIDDLRREGGIPFSVPQSMGPAYLAGAFSPELCEIKLYNEQFSGILTDEKLLAWPDMLVLTGLTISFDRFRQLTAYARTKNPAVIIVAGGPAVRVLPGYSQQFFDYPCLGDVEQMRDVVTDAFGSAYATKEMAPRFDLVSGLAPFGYVESSRYCNFKCNFCALTAENRQYKKYDIDRLRRDLRLLGKKHIACFIDNNFYGNDRQYFLDRLELIKELQAQGEFGSWTALVTDDFFLKSENLTLAREAGCLGLFSGVESFDVSELRRFNKLQNTRLPQIEHIRSCLATGMVFTYGLMFDFTVRRVADCRSELDTILDTKDISLPSFISVAIPMLGTPTFYEALDQGMFFPATKLRDLDGRTQVLQPLDPLEEVLPFLRELANLSNHRIRVLRHLMAFAWHYRKTLSAHSLLTMTVANLMPAFPALMSPPTRLLGNVRRLNRRTFLSTTEPLDSPYRPAFRVDSRYQEYFQPTMVTDSRGCLAEELVEDLEATRSLPKTGTNGAAFSYSG